MSLVVKSVARDNQKTVTFSSFDEWHTWEADAFRIDPVGVDVTPPFVTKENIETRHKMKEVGKKNKNRTTSIATDESVNGASASSGSVIGEVVNTPTLRSNKLKKITSFRNVVAERKKAGTKEILSSFIDNDVKLYSSAPVQQLDVVIPDLACDVSLLSNELEGNKLKIWDEDESVESRLPGINILTKACMTVVDINRRCESSAEEFIFPPASSGMTCKDGISDTERKRQVRWTSSAATDHDDDSDDDNDDDETSIGDVEHGSLFSCGTETQRITENLGDLGNDVQSGIAHAVRRLLLLLLGSYDITRDELQLDVTNQKSKSKQKYCGDEVGTPTSINATDKQKRFLVKLKELATNAVGLKHDEKNMGKPKTAIDKRKMYVQKLKEMSLMHV